MIDDPNRRADAAALIRQVEEVLALELGNSGTGCPHWLADIYVLLDAALQALGDPERVAADSPPAFAK